MLTLWGFHSVLRFIPCCRQCEIMALFPLCWLWIAVDNVFYVHLLQLLLVSQSGFDLSYPTKAEFRVHLGIVAWIRPFVLINAFFRY